MAIRAGAPTLALQSRPADPAELVLGVLTSSAQRKGSLARTGLDRHSASLAEAIRRHTARDRPVELTLMAFPFKVPNPAKVGPRTLPDLAEQAALTRLLALDERVRAVYGPGLRLNVILDGLALAPIVGIDEREVLAYRAYLARLVTGLGADRIVALHDFSELLRDSVADLAAEERRLRRLARRWWTGARGAPEWNDAFRRTVGMINLRDSSVEEATRVMDLARQGSLPPSHSDVERRATAAMLEYRVFDLLIHQLEPRAYHFPDAIHATTVERPGRLALWLVRRGRSHLPWHGVAAVDDAGKVRVGSYRELVHDGRYRPVTLPGEDSPFMYSSVAPHALESRPRAVPEPGPREPHPASVARA